MAIKSILDNLEGVEESHKPLYKESNGKYILDVEPVGGYALEDVSGLKNALQSERATRQKEAQRLKAFGDKDPEAVRAALEELESLKGQTGDLDSKAAALAESKVKQIVEKHQRELATFGETHKTLRSKLETVMVDQNLASAIRGAGGDESTVRVLMPHLKGQVRLREIDGDYVPEVIDPSTGHARIGDSQGSLMNLSQLVGEFKNDPVFSGTFPGSGRSGGGTASSSNSRSKGGFPSKKSDFTMTQKMDFIEKHDAMTWLNLPD